MYGGGRKFKGLSRGNSSVLQAYWSHLNVSQSINQTLNDTSFYVVRHLFFELDIVTALVRQSCAANYYVLDRALVAPTKPLSGRTVTGIVVLALHLVFDGFGPFVHKRFGRLVRTGYLSDLCARRAGTINLSL